MTQDEQHPLQPLREGVAPDADPVFRRGLDVRLRVAHAERSTRKRWWSSLSRVAVAVPVLTALLLIATVAVVARNETVVAALELRDAENVVVTLPNGDEIHDPEDGFRLTDGAVIVVGAGGEVTIDDVMLSEGTVVTVRDGILVSDVVATSTTRPDEVVDRPRPTDGATDSRDPTRSTTTRRDATRGESPLPPELSRPTDRDQPGDAVHRDGTRLLDPPTVTDPTDNPPTVESPTHESSTVDSPTVDSPTVDGPTDDAPRRPDGVPLGIALRLFANDGHVRVVWRVQGLGDEPWAVVVVRTDDGTDPDWPVGAGAVVGEGPSGELVERRVDLPDVVTSLRYRVLVVDESGGVVARGAVQTLSGQ